MSVGVTTDPKQTN